MCLRADFDEAESKWEEGQPLYAVWMASSAVSFLSSLFWLQIGFLIGVALRYLCVSRVDLYGAHSKHVPAASDRESCIQIVLSHYLHAGILGMIGASLMLYRCHRSLNIKLAVVVTVRSQVKLSCQCASLILSSAQTFGRIYVLTAPDLCVMQCRRH